MKIIFKKILLTTVALLSITCPLIGMDDAPMDSSQSPTENGRPVHSKPLYAVYISHTARENFETLLSDAMTVLSDQVLMKMGLKPMDIVQSANKRDFNVDLFIPTTLDGDMREAIRTIAVHYAHLNSVRTTLSNALAHDVNLNYELDIQSLFQTCQFNIQEVPLSRSGSYTLFKATQHKVANQGDQEHQIPEEKVLYYASVPNPFDSEYPRKFLSILFMDKPTDDVLEESLNSQSLSLKKIMDTYKFMESYTKIPTSNQINDFMETISAGAELKDALDVFLGTKRVNLQQGPMFFGGQQHEYQRNELLALTEEVKSYKEELEDETITDQKVKSRLEAEMRIARARGAALARTIKILDEKAEREAETGLAKDMFPEHLIEQAKMRQKILLILKKAGELFSSAFSESREARLNHIQNMFDIHNERSN